MIAQELAELNNWIEDIKASFKEEITTSGGVNNRGELIFSLTYGNPEILHVRSTVYNYLKRTVNTLLN